ncbi:MAG: L-aspartate oxidase [Candidatus Gastranaerophilales bacterium]|nr:L-aspartate oxidase [Candidatus Gastranaerophilales bacterium]
MKHVKYSAVIAGSGIAGLYAAIKLQKEADLPNGLLIITKSRLIESNSKYAQGGMVCVMPENKLDSTTLHIEDTLKAGAGLSDPEVAEFISQKSAQVVKELQNLGVDFDRDENNRLKFTKEAAHSVNRILHARGDATGFCIENALVKYILSQKNIDIYEQTLAVELLTDSKNINRGLIAYNYSENEYKIIEAPAVILATGGIGQLYKYTTNPDITTGDGIALAYRAGAIVKDMEFVQFHPTAFALSDKGTMFLISEAVRGEGAKLVDKNGCTFMEKYDKRLELAPRDIVTRAIYNEMSKTHVKNVYLNAAHISEEKFEKRFPTIFGTCKEYNINPSKDYIPVSPSAHYFMGGVKTKVNGNTSIQGLYAIGEVSCTGLHGANRLASNSILECAVTAYELVNHLKTLNLNDNYTEDKQISEIINFYNDDIFINNEYDEKEMIKELKQLMWDNAGIIRNGEKLSFAKDKIQKMKEQFGYIYKCPGRNHYELRNMLIIAGLIIDFALERKESRGAHYREDFPKTNTTSKSHQLSIHTIMKG